LIWLAASLVLLVNLPFGWWRAGLRKLSPAWFAAVHAPVPAVVGIRWALGLGFEWRTLPLFLAAYFAGQFLGAALGRRAGRRPIAAG
jgi:hypothetical protein